MRLLHTRYTTQQCMDAGRPFSTVAALLGELAAAWLDAIGLLQNLQASARGTQGIDFFLALVRFLRVLRIFRLFQLGSRVSSEVNSRLMALACTLLSLIMISASLFLEIETAFGVSRAAAGRAVRCRTYQLGVPGLLAVGAAAPLLTCGSACCRTSIRTSPIIKPFTGALSQQPPLVSCMTQV
jgi:hypothetical protein